MFERKTTKPYFALPILHGEGGPREAWWAGLFAACAEVEISYGSWNTSADAQAALFMGPAHHSLRSWSPLPMKNGEGESCP
jgi:hypothetical protein